MHIRNYIRKHSLGFVSNASMMQSPYLLFSVRERRATRQFWRRRLKRRLSSGAGFIVPAKPQIQGPVAEYKNRPDPQRYLAYEAVGPLHSPSHPPWYLNLRDLSGGITKACGGLIVVITWREWSRNFRHGWPGPCLRCHDTELPLKCFPCEKAVCIPTFPTLGDYLGLSCKLLLVLELGLQNWSCSTSAVPLQT